MVKWIHEELGDLSVMELTKVSLDIFIKNLSVYNLSKIEKESIARYFSRELLGGQEARGYTS